MKQALPWITPSPQPGTPQLHSDEETNKIISPNPLQPAQRVRKLTPLMAHVLYVETQYQYLKPTSEIVIGVRIVD